MAGWQRSKNGYRKVGLFGNIIYEHRLILLMVEGKFPEFLVDHINGVKDDNRYENLRHANGSQNIANIGAKRDNKSGAKNVHWCNRRNKWIAKVKLYWKTHYAGSFDRYEEAVNASVFARNRVHGEFSNHTNRDACMVAWALRGAR